MRIDSNTRMPLPRRECSTRRQVGKRTVTVLTVLTVPTVLTRMNKSGEKDSSETDQKRRTAIK